MKKISLLFLILSTTAWGETGNEVELGAVINKVNELTEYVNEYIEYTDGLMILLTIGFIIVTVFIVKNKNNIKRMKIELEKKIEQEMKDQEKTITSYEKEIMILREKLTKLRGKIDLFELTLKR